MIARISGVLRELHKHLAVLEVGPFWYDVMLPASVAARLPEPGVPIALYTLDFIEGAAMGTVSHPRLVGFLEPLERDFLLQFTSVSGLGLRSALQAMTIPVCEIALAIERGDEKRLKELPKIGPKTAKKIIADLQGKMGKYAMLPEGEKVRDFADTHSDRTEMILDARHVLIAQLHYPAKTADSLIEAALKADSGIASPDALLQAVFRAAQR